MVEQVVITNPSSQQVIEFIESKLFGFLLAWMDVAYCRATLNDVHIQMILQKMGYEYNDVVLSKEDFQEIRENIHALLTQQSDGKKSWIDTFETVEREYNLNMLF